MKKAEFNINTKDSVRSVNGYVGKVEFIVPENNHFTLFFGINKNPSRYALDRRWIVTELSTGMSLSYGRTQKEAIECSCRVIRRNGVPDFFESVEETVLRLSSSGLNVELCESLKRMKAEFTVDF